MILSPNIERIQSAIMTARENRNKYRITEQLHIDGITVEELNLGYAVEDDQEVIILPVWNGVSHVGYYSYCPRLKLYTADIATDENDKPIPAVFNPYAITGKKALFFVSCPMDAVALKEMGYNAIACDDDSITAFIAKWDSVKDKPPVLYLISWAGCDMSAPAEAMQNHGIAFKPITLSGSPFEMLQADRKRIEDEIRIATAEDITPAEIEAVNAHRVASLITAFDNHIAEAAKYKPIKTGFDQFDDAIGGGLWAKLYVIGAVASLGKTTFALQMMDNIAHSGNDVIIFSLEMPTDTIIARSISRYTRIINKSAYAFTESDVLRGDLYSAHSKERMALLERAKAEYMSNAEHISIYEGRRTADDIRQIIEQHIKVRRTRPVILIDYLQLIKPAKNLQRATVREQVDYNIEVLAALRNDYKTPVVVISAFNRDSYEGNPTETAFKESGTIEYTADAVITLDYCVPRKRDAKGNYFEKEAAYTTRRAEEIAKMLSTGERTVLLKFLKNRGNQSHNTISYEYKAKYNLFSEMNG